MLLQKDYVLSSEIKEKLSISIRTVRMEIHLLNDVLRSINISIHSSPKKGYYFYENDKQPAKLFLDKLIEQAKSSNLPETTNERFLFLLLYLAFLDDDYTTIKDLANIMYVSNTSIVNSLKEIDSYLKDFDDVKIQTSLRGIQLKGSEPVIRHILSETLNYRTYGSILMDKVLRFIFGEEYKDLYTYLQSHIINLLDKNQYYLIDKSIEGFILDVFISIKREEKAFYLNRKVIEGSKNKIIEDLRDLLKHRGILLNEENFSFLNECLGTKRFFYRNNPNKINQHIIKEMTKNFLLDVDESFNTTFFSNETLINKLSIHVEKLLLRLYQGHFEHNPVLQDIKKDYPQSMEMAKLINNYLFEHFQQIANEHELSYIAIYLVMPAEQVLNAVVISDIGEGIADNMIRQLKEHCGNKLKINGKITLSYLREHPVDVDLIITASRIFNVELPNHVQIIYVNYILKDIDIKRIQNLLLLGTT